MAKLRSNNVEIRATQKLIFNADTSTKYMSTAGGQVYINTTLSGVAATEDYHFTRKDDVVALLPTDFYSQAETDALITTASGDIVSQIPSDFYSQAQVDAKDTVLDTKIDTTSGTLQDQIDNLDTGYVTEAELTTASGDIVSQIPVNHSDLNDDEATKHRLINDSGEGATELWSSTKIASEITTATGSLTQDHSGLNELDYASAGHTGFVSDAALATFSGTIDHDTILNNHNLTTDIDHDALTNFESNEHFTEASIDKYTQAEVDSISGTLSDQIQESAANTTTTYYLHEDASDIGGYETLRGIPSDDAESQDTVVIGSGDGETLIEPYITVSGEPNTTAIQPGTWTMILWADVSSVVSGPHYIRAKHYRREQGGTEHFLFTQEAEITSTDPTRYLVETSTSGIDMATTDRLVVKMYAEVGSAGDRTIGYYVEGIDHPTRFATPVYTSLITAHGDLTGLGNDDHEQYLPVDGTRDMSGDLHMLDTKKVYLNTGDTSYITNDGSSNVLYLDSTDVITQSNNALYLKVSGNDQVIITNQGFGLFSGTRVNDISLDRALSGNSDDSLCTEKTIKTYVDGEITTVMDLDPTPDSDLTGNGMTATMTVDANSTGIGAPLYMASDGNYEEACASGIDYMPCRALALETGTGSKSVMLQGFIRDDSRSWTPGDDVYVSASGVGLLTQSAHTDVEGYVVQKIGFATSATEMFFNPGGYTAIVVKIV